MQKLRRHLISPIVTKKKIAFSQIFSLWDVFVKVWCGFRHTVCSCKSKWDKRWMSNIKYPLFISLALITFMMLICLCQGSFSVWFSKQVTTIIIIIAFLKNYNIIVTIVWGISIHEHVHSYHIFHKLFFRQNKVTAEVYSY